MEFASCHNPAGLPTILIIIRILVFRIEVQEPIRSGKSDLVCPSVIDLTILALGIGFCHIDILCSYSILVSGWTSSWGARARTFRDAPYIELASFINCCLLWVGIGMASRCKKHALVEIVKRETSEKNLSLMNNNNNNNFFGAHSARRQQPHHVRFEDTRSLFVNPRIHIASNYNRPASIAEALLSDQSLQLIGNGNHMSLFLRCSRNNSSYFHSHIIECLCFN